MSSIHWFPANLQNHFEWCIEQEKVAKSIKLEEISESEQKSKKGLQWASSCFKKYNFYQGK